MKPQRLVQKFQIFIFFICFGGFFSSLASTNHFKNCLPQEIQQIKEAEEFAFMGTQALIQSIQEALPEISYNIINPYSTRQRLTRALTISKCALKKIHRAEYTCTEKRIGISLAKTRPIVGRTITINSLVFDLKSDSLLPGILVHEATHKCGTTDMVYFNSIKFNETALFQKYEVPYDAWGVPWDAIASTYDYWIENGFCIPNETCE